MITGHVKMSGVSAEHRTVGGDRRTDRYDAAVGAVVPAVSTVTAAAVAVLGTVNALQATGATRVALVCLAAVTVAYLVGVRLWLLAHDLPTRWAHPVLVSMVVLFTVSTCLHLYLAKDARLTGNAVLIVVGAGALVLDLRWMVGCLAFVWVLWGAALVAIPVPGGRVVGSRRWSGPRSWASSSAPCAAPRSTSSATCWSGPSGPRSRTT